MRIAVYAGVSTDKQDNGNQLIQLREFATKQEWEVIAEYVDTVSGSGKKDRSQFRRMMTEASQRTFNLMIKSQLGLRAAPGASTAIGAL